MIIQRIKQIFGLGHQIINKETFLKELKTIVKEKQEPGYDDIVDAEIENLDPFDRNPKVMYQSRNLIWKYERENSDTVQWLGEIALNKENNFDDRTEAIEDLRYTDNSKAIDYLLECLKDEDYTTSFVALRILEDKLDMALFRSILNANPNHDKDMEFPNKIDQETISKNLKIKDQLIEKLTAIETRKDSLIQSFGNDKPLVNITNELKIWRKELFDSSIQKDGEQRTKISLINIALDVNYRIADASHQAFLTLKENNGVEDLITVIKKRLKDPLQGVKFVDKTKNE